MPSCEHNACRGLVDLWYLVFVVFCCLCRQSRSSQFIFPWRTRIVSLLVSLDCHDVAGVFHVKQRAPSSWAATIETRNETILVHFFFFFFFCCVHLKYSEHWKRISSWSTERSCTDCVKFAFALLAKFVGRIVKVRRINEAALDQWHRHVSFQFEPVHAHSDLRWRCLNALGLALLHSFFVYMQFERLVSSFDRTQFHDGKVYLSSLIAFVFAVDYLIKVYPRRDGMSQMVSFRQLKAVHARVITDWEMSNLSSREKPPVETDFFSVVLVCSLVVCQESQATWLDCVAVSWLCHVFQCYFANGLTTQENVINCQQVKEQIVICAQDLFQMWTQHVDGRISLVLLWYHLVWVVTNLSHSASRVVELACAQLMQMKCAEF